MFQQPQRKKGLFEFKAGRMNIDGDNVTADSEKGLCVIVHEDTLKHFQWMLRNGTVVEDLIVFPDEATFTKINQFLPSKLFMLDVGRTKKIYWAQENLDDSDCDEIVQKVNALLKCRSSKEKPKSNISSGIVSSVSMTTTEGEETSPKDVSSSSITTQLLQLQLSLEKMKRQLGNRKKQLIPL